MNLDRSDPPRDVIVSGPVRRPSKPNPSAFGRELRKRRRSAELTLEGLAELTGIHASTLSLIESGRRLPPEPPAVAAIAEAVGLSPESNDYQMFLVQAQRERAERRGSSRPITARQHSVVVVDEMGQAVGAAVGQIHLLLERMESANLPTALKMILDVELSEGIDQIIVTSRSGSSHLISIMRKDISNG